MFFLNYRFILLLGLLLANCLQFYLFLLLNLLLFLLLRLLLNYFFNYFDYLFGLWLLSLLCSLGLISGHLRGHLRLLNCHCLSYCSCRLDFLFFDGLDNFLFWLFLCLSNLSLSYLSGCSRRNYSWCRCSYFNLNIVKGLIIL